MKISVAIILAVFLSHSGVADETDDRAAVMRVIDAFFISMTAKDTVSMQKILTEDGILYGYRAGAEAPSTFSITHAAYLANLGSREGIPVERIWDPKIDIDDRIAVVWTPYDFYNDATFSHCGMNTFSLLKGDDGWRITGVVFSVQTENCAESPLGPFKPDSAMK